MFGVMCLCLRACVRLLFESRVEGVKMPRLFSGWGLARVPGGRVSRLVTPLDALARGIRCAGSHKPGCEFGGVVSAVVAGASRQAGPGQGT